ncbi:alpha/beta fold hydrolase [Streptomyces virginiae]|uniref:alpha/beta fold hydrolase n=1 Tax=Streptomyces virginiae TaxID=1961 RepID=UPI0030D5A14C
MSSVADAPHRLPPPPCNRTHRTPPRPPSGRPALLCGHSLGPQAIEAMPAEQLEEAITYAAAEVADGTVEHAELAGRIDVRDDLAAIGVPTLVISTTDDHLAPPALHRRLAENIPGARLVEIPTGHLPMVESPGEWQRLITDFLAEHDA